MGITNEAFEERMVGIAILTSLLMKGGMIKMLGLLTILKIVNLVLCLIFKSRMFATLAITFELVQILIIFKQTKEES